MAKRALVTGGAGFVGSHLCERLLSCGREVIALDNLWTGSISNLASVMKNPRFRFVEHDVRRPFWFDVDEIWNLASPASPPAYQADPVATTLANVVGTANGLELAARTGARFFQASTSEVYGDPVVHPQPEEYRGNVNTTGIRACYDEGKRCAESLVMDFHRTRGVDVRIARIFNTYGPRMSADDGRVVSNFIKQALAGSALTIYGSGQQTRSFCYVDDLIDGFLLLMEHRVEKGPINLGNPHEFTVLELAEMVLKLTASQSRIMHVPLPADDPQLRRPVIEKAQRVLGFAPQVSLEEGLRRMIACFQNKGTPIVRRFVAAAS